MIGFSAVTAQLAIRRSRVLVERVADERSARQHLGRYFSPAVAERIAADQQRNALSAEEREVSVLLRCRSRARRSRCSPTPPG